MKNFKKNKLINSNFIHPILSGILLFLSYNYPVIWFFGLFSLVPLIHFSYKIKKSQEALLGFFLFSFIFVGGVMFFLLKINIFAWSGISNFWLTQSILGAYWLFFVLIVGVPAFLILGWLFFRLKTRTFLDIFLFASLWILAEHLKSLAFAVASFGNESLFAPHSTLSFLGYILASNGILLQLAQFGGVYLLSFVLVVINFSIYWGFFRSKKIQLELKFLILVVFIVFINIPLDIFIKEDKSKEQEIKVSVLQTKNEAFFLTTTAKEKQKTKIYEKLLLKVRKESPGSEIIIFPEDTRFTQELIDRRKLENYYKSIFSDHEKMVIDSSRMLDENNQTKLRLYYYDVEKAQMDKYDKLLFTPGGEYFPSIFIFLSRLIGFGDWAKELNEGKYTRGESIEIGHFKNKGIGGIFCFEITSPEISRKMTQKGAQLFVNPSSHSTFKGYPVLYNQIINMTKVRAVENNRYFIQAGNYINSSIITNKGEIVSTDFIGEEILTENVFFIKKETVFTRFGNWFVGLSLVVVIIFIGWFLVLKKVDTLV